MGLAAGTKLGPYEILGPLGAGGMGEVYRARDSRLDRTVAIKVLPTEFVHDAQRRARIEREARAISALSHPHICTLYDLGRHDGLDFLVLEYLEGTTLDQRLQQGPLPVAEAVRIGIEIAEALESAHSRGIVHRDLKPGNIMLTRSGAKLLDFGLAKYAQQAPVIEGLSTLPTEHKPLTDKNVVVGTF